MTATRPASRPGLGPADRAPTSRAIAAETRDRVRELLGEELKWRLVPVRIEPSVYDRLVQIAPDGDMAELLNRAVEKLISETSQ